MPTKTSRRAISIHSAVVAAAMIAASNVAAIAETPCRASVGAEQAANYVRQCTEVSPATHPPCNASNACALIIAEIRRGCRLIGASAPAFCNAYK